MSAAAPAFARAPRRARLRAVAGAAALLATTLGGPALGQPVVIDSYVGVLDINPGFSCGNNCFTTGTRALQITASGELNAPIGHGIVLGGPLHNLGRLRAAFGAEIGGLDIGGGGLNGEDALIQAHTLYVRGGAGAGFDNRGLLLTGIYTVPPPNGREATAPALGAGASIGGGTTLRNLKSPLLTVHPDNGTWRNFGAVTVAGVFDNAGDFRAEFNPQTTLPASGVYWPQLLVKNTGDQAKLINRAQGRLFFNASTQLSNGGHVDNSGVINIAGGGVLYNDPGVSNPLYVQPGQLAGWIDNRAGGRIVIGEPGQNFGLLWNAGGSIVNHGDIEFRGAGYYDGLSFRGVHGSLENHGRVVQARDARLLNGILINQPSGTLDLGGTSFLGYLSNQGQLISRPGSALIAQAGSALYNEGGRIELGGRITVIGSLQNGNFNLPATPSTIDILAGGELSVAAGGHFEQHIGSRVNNAGRLVVAGTAVGGALEPVTLRNSGELVVQAGGSWQSQAGELHNEAGGRVTVAGRMTGLLGDGSSPPTTAAWINNEGDFVIETGARVHAYSFTQLAGNLQVQGDLLIDAGLPGDPDNVLRMTGGSLSGSGRINGDVFFQGSGPPLLNPGCNPAPPTGVPCFKPGNSPGHMGIDGALTMGANSVLELEVERDGAGLLHWDTVSATRMSFLDGALIRVLLGSGVAGALPSHLSFLSCAEACDFAGAVFEVSGAGSGQFAFGAQGLQFTLAPVPEPGQWALWLAGLAGLGALARRRRAASNPS